MKGFKVEENTNEEIIDTDSTEVVEKNVDTDNLDVTTDSEEKVVEEVIEKPVTKQRKTKRQSTPKAEVKMLYPGRRLQYGANGEYVAAIQHKLGMDTTGVFDFDTHKAVKAWQLDRNLKVDGIVGPRTWSTMFG